MLEENRFNLTIVFVIGVLGLIVISLLSYFYKVEFLAQMGFIALTQFFVGREVAMISGAAQGIPLATMIIGSAVEDVFVLFMGYPIFVMFHSELKRTRLLSEPIKRLEKVQQEKDNPVRKYGLIGIFVLCFVPLQVTGALTAACIAKLFGFKMNQIFPIVLVASLSSSVIWAVTVSLAMDLIKLIYAEAPYIAIIIALLLLIAFIYLRLRIIKKRL
ncbi:MAG: small multi-drug export protein [Methanocellales archaeon]